MNHYVPEFELDLSGATLPTAPPSPLTFSGHKISGNMIEEDDTIMELVWRKGQVVTQVQNQRSIKKPTRVPSEFYDAAVMPSEQNRESRLFSTSQLPHDQQQQSNLLIQEDEMASRLNYLLHDANFAPASPPVPLFPPLPVQNFTHSSQQSNAVATPAVRSTVGATGEGNPVTKITTTTGCGQSVTSSTEAQLHPIGEQDRKRKGRQEDEMEKQCRDEDAESELETKKFARRSTTFTKRSRAAEAHNLSERRRRDKINEKMKALQGLIPRCNKSDKASMLDEAIEYLKSLQLQVQMMSMGCNMVSTMCPGVQQYMPPMGMGSGMEMGINRPIMPFQNVFSGTSLPSPTVATQLGSRFLVPPFHVPPIPASVPSRFQEPHPTLNSLNPNQAPIPTFVGPYQRCINLEQMQVPVPENHPAAQPSSSKPSTKGPGNPANQQLGNMANLS